jgi:transposase
LIEPTLTAWRKARLDRRPTGKPAKVELRDVFNAILYVNRTGIPWKYLPHDFPRHGTVYAYYAAWRDEGIFAQLNYDLTGLARVKEGRKPEPTASVIDTQSVKTSTNVPLTSQGTDAAKKIVGRKRGILTDTIGLIPGRDRHRRRPVGERPRNSPPRPGQGEVPDHLQELGRHWLQERRR